MAILIGLENYFLKRLEKLKADIDFFVFDRIDDYILVLDNEKNVVFENLKVKRELESDEGENKCFKVIYNSVLSCRERGLECPLDEIKKKNLTKYYSLHNVKINGRNKSYLVLIYKLLEGELFVEMFVDIENLKESLLKDFISAQRVLENIPKGIFLETDDFFYCNSRFREIFNYRGEASHPLEETLNSDFNGSIPEYYIIKLIKEIKQKNEPVVDNKIKLSDDKYLSIAYIPISLNGKRANLWIFDDITNQQKKEEKLKESEELFRTLAETSAAGIFLQKGKLLYVNPALCEITEYSKEELLNMNALELIHPDYKGMVREIIQRRLKGDRTKLNYEIKLITKSGKEKWVQIASSAVKYKGSYVGIGTVIDITDRKEYEERLKKLATYDSLTGLYNRYMIEEFLTKEIEKSKRHNIPLSVIMCDIDNFKRINDTYGHIEGDKVLKELSNTMKSNIRKSDAIGRWGGEEFIIVAPYTDKYGALKLANKLRRIIEEKKINGKNVTISCGVAEFRYNEKMKDLIKRVDEALYTAKRKGKNRVEISL